MPWLLTSCEDYFCFLLFLALRNCCLAIALLVLCKTQALAPAAQGFSGSQEKWAGAPASPGDEILLSVGVLWVTTVLINNLRASLLCCRAGQLWAGGLAVAWPVRSQACTSAKAQ